MTRTRTIVAAVTAGVLLLGAGIFAGRTLASHQPATTPAAALSTTAAPVTTSRSHAGSPSAGSDSSQATTSTEPTTRSVPELPARALGTATLPASVAGVNRADPKAVAATALRIMLTVDASVDRSPNDALLRARPLLSSRYRALLRSGMPTAPVGAEWRTWTAKKAATKVSIRLAGDYVPPATSTSAAAICIVTVTATGTAGYRQATHSTIYVSLTKPAGGSAWSLDTLQVM